MKDESAVWAAFRKHVPAQVMAKRIEDRSGNLGTWDTWIGSMHLGGWIELKHTQTVNRKPNLRPGQFAFGCDLEKAFVGGCYFVGSSDGKVRILEKLYDGEDWKKFQINQYDSVTKQCVMDTLRLIGLKRL